MPYRTSSQYLKQDFGIKLSHETVKQIAVSAGHQIARIRNENSDIEGWEKLDGPNVIVKRP